MSRVPNAYCTDELRVREAAIRHQRLVNSCNYRVGVLGLQNNQISGSLPRETVNLNKLRRLDISYNSFNVGAAELCRLTDPTETEGNLVTFIADCFSNRVPATHSS